jgi:hypothetical protein
MNLTLRYANENFDIPFQQTSTFPSSNKTMNSLSVSVDLWCIT